MDDLFGDVISEYSREDALLDGVLIDVTLVAIQAGFPVLTLISFNLEAEFEVDRDAELLKFFTALRTLIRGLKDDPSMIKLKDYPLPNGPRDIFMEVDGTPSITVMLAEDI